MARASFALVNRLPLFSSASGVAAAAVDAVFPGVVGRDLMANYMSQAGALARKKGSSMAGRCTLTGV